MRAALHAAARLFSNLLSPPAVSAALGFAVAWKQHGFWPGALRGLVFGALVSLAPLILVVYLYKTGRISDLHMSRSLSQRHLPYLAAFLSALAAFLVFAAWEGLRRPGLPALTGLAACSTVCLGLLGVINRAWLISNHTASIMLAALYTVFLYGAPAAWLILPLVALVIWSRWLLDKHTPLQMAAGLLVGAAPVIILAGLGWLTP
ncbi:MAG: hypothetical protein ACKOC5_09690 [Chloroflexota bacterium]